MLPTAEKRDFRFPAGGSSKSVEFYLTTKVASSFCHRSLGAPNVFGSVFPQVVAQSSRGECTEACRSRRRELETELGECRAAKHWAEERYAALERENAALLDQLRDMDILMTALSAMQEKNAHLENSLSAETRIKLDLFSALGEAKRQLEIRESECLSRLDPT